MSTFVEHELQVMRINDWCWLSQEIVEAAIMITLIMFLSKISLFYILFMWTNWSASVINVHYAKMQHQNKSIISIFIIIVKINQHVWKSSKNANISLMLINLPTHNDGIMRSSPNHKVNSLYYRSSFFTWHWIIILSSWQTQKF